jgi:hypothetical protein
MLILELLWNFCVSKCLASLYLGTVRFGDMTGLYCCWLFLRVVAVFVASIDWIADKGWSYWPGSNYQRTVRSKALYENQKLHCYSNIHNCSCNESHLTTLGNAAYHLHHFRLST